MNILAQICLAVFFAVNMHSIDAFRERVAFLFAGSVRSFVFPYVHRSIQENLLKSFCPVESCDLDVFIRFSESDNFHKGLNSNGIAIEASQHQLSDTARIIEEMNVQFPGRIHAKRVDIDSNLELSEMLHEESFPQKVYRTLDKRRYSMFFGRDAVFRMMEAFETINSIKFTRVVHARLDMAWGTPQFPVHLWSNEKVFVPDSWYSDVPDTFAVVPRKYAELYFALDKLLVPQAMCLGGPNFHPDLLKPNNLTNLGFSQSEIEWIIKEDCAIKFPEYSTILDEPTNLHWSVGGVSEYILDRKLKFYRLSVQEQTLEFTSIFSVIVRSNHEVSCFYFDVDHFIPWQKHIHASNSAVHQGCEALQHHVNRANHEKNPFQFCNDKYKSNIDCISHKNITQLNFMPFRLRTRGSCLTSTWSQVPVVNSSECVNYHLEGSYMVKYLAAQLFHFFPSVSKPQQISTLTRITLERHCLTVSASGLKSKNKIPVVTRLCQPSPDSPTYAYQLFQVSVMDEYGRNLQDLGDTPMPPEIYGRLYWTSEANVTYCAFMQHTMHSSSTLVLSPCQLKQPAGNTKIRMPHLGVREGHLFAMERTQPHGEPLQHGKTIGSFPKW